jgi:predicted nucleotidyltransferase component of viral defense system
VTTKAKGNSVRQKIVNLSHDRGIPYQNLETVFMLERLVARLVADEILHKCLVFKGGFVGLRVYDSLRYTVDVDALIVKADVESTLERAKEKTESDLGDGVWFRFEDHVDLATQGEYGGIRQIYRAGIGEVLQNLKKARVVHFDVGIGDPVTPGPLAIETPSLLSPCEGLGWSVYPIETIIAEKLHALIAHGNLNSRAKDVYDLAAFLPRADAEVLGHALKRCFTHRSTELSQNLSATLRAIDTTSLERGWISATASVAEKIQFKTAFDVVVTSISDMEISFRR